jgi:hypothetical protein
VLDGAGLLDSSECGGLVLESKSLERLFNSVLESQRVAGLRVGSELCFERIRTNSLHKWFYRHV